MNQPLLRSRAGILVVSVFLAGVFVFISTGRNLAAPSVFDWDVPSNSWPAGSLMEIYPGIGSPATVFTFTFSGDTDLIENNRPQTQKDHVDGGIDPPEFSLFFSAGFNSNTQSITLTIELSAKSTGVSFLLLDVDSPIPGGLGIDQVAVSGLSPLGTVIFPILTAADPSCVSIVANVATGLCDVDNHTDNGNVLVTFIPEVKKIFIVFGEASPGSPLEAHGIALHDIHFDPEAPTPTPSPTGPTPTPVTPTPTPSENYNHLPLLRKP
jgi:hypothetical protein